MDATTTQSICLNLGVQPEGVLGSVFSRPEPLRANGTAGSVPKAQHIAQHSAREKVRLGAKERSNKCSDLDQETSHLSKENAEETQRFVTLNANSGGGIRTPDTRIMMRAFDSTKFASIPGKTA